MKSPRQLFTQIFWLDTFERLIATAGETFFGVLAGGLVSSVNWQVGGVTIATAVVVSLAKALVAAAKADTDTASLVVDSKPLTK